MGEGAETCVELDELGAEAAAPTAVAEAFVVLELEEAALLPPEDNDTNGGPGKVYLAPASKNCGQYE